MGFPFLFAICAAAMIAIGFVDIEKGREDSRKFVQDRRIAQVSAECRREAHENGSATSVTPVGVGS
jgi:hypothetical protein